MSQLIEKLRETHKNVSLIKLVNTYFDLLVKIDECKKKKDFKNMLMYCQMSLPLIEPLIKQTKKESGKFDIKSIPAIEIGSIFWAVHGADGQLLNLKEIVEYFPELEPWKVTIHKSFEMKDLASKIYQHVKNNGGCLQKDLKKILEVEDGRLISIVIYYMSLIGRLDREKVGDTYALFVK